MQKYNGADRRNVKRRRMTGSEKTTNIILGVIAAIIAAYLGVDIDQYRQDAEYDSGKYMQHITPQ